MTTVERPVRAHAILSGVETLARMLVLRHGLDERDGLTTATMVSGYPGSPLGTVDLVLEQASAEMAAHRIVHRPGLNEELAAATAWGSQMGASVPYSEVDGVVGAWYGKGPGLDRSGDVIKHGNAMGAGPNGGVVMFCGDDPSSKSSTLACDSHYTFADACVPVLFPGDQQDVLDLGVHAFRMSRYSGAWAALKLVTAVADGVGTVDLDPDRHHPSDPVGLVVDGTVWRHEPLTRIGPHAVPDQEILVVERRLRAAQEYVRHNGLDRVVGAEPGAELGIVCAGKTYYDVVQALSDLGVGLDELAGAGLRILKLALTYPVVEETILDFAGSVRRLLVIEEKRPFIESQLRTILHEAGVAVPVLGKRDADKRQLVSPIGELDAAAVSAILTRVLPALSPPKPVRTGRVLLPLLATPPRAPAFCSGCPHNRSTVAPDGALVGGGVGCHGMVYFEERHRDTRALPPTPMGAEGVPWIGLSPFVDEPHLIQNLGDGTLSHSGILAIRATIAAKVDITYKILYNEAVAMTGGQEVTGLMDVPALTRELSAEGVRRIVVCAEEPKRYGRRARWAPGVTVLGRDHLDEVQNELRATPGVTVIIYDQRCAAEARRLRKRGELPTPPRRVIINEAVCEGCGDCAVKSNCLSVLPVETEFGIKRQIHDPSCNRDYTCLEGDCPSFVTITPRKGKRRRSATRATGRPDLPPGELPTPAIPAVQGGYGVYFTGIGGTGVVTASRILARAAEEAGLAIGGMDQTGLSQKAGPVVSHLRFAVDHDALGAATVGVGGADLYISGDILQAAGGNHLARIEAGRTRAVVDLSVTPTPGMLQSGGSAPDSGALAEVIASRVGADRSIFLDAKHIAESVFGDNLMANVVLVGAAFQAGGLPFALADIEAGIGDRGRSAAGNRAAFTWGRWAAHDPEAVAKALSAVEDAAAQGVRAAAAPTEKSVRIATPLVAARSLPEPLRELLIRRAAQTVDYQNARYAQRYLDLVGRVAEHDDAEHDWSLTRAAAEAYYKVLCYKDEYEVARLHVAADYGAEASKLGIEGDYKVTYHLHPPALRRMGLKHKLPLAATYGIGFKVLRHLKGLRGTPFDVPGWDPDRRMERALITEYERVVDDLVVVGGVGAPSYEQRLEAVSSVLDVKGYAGIKEAAVHSWRDRVAALRSASGDSVGASA